MMLFLYNAAVRLLGVGYYAVSFFHRKAKLFVAGRKNIFSRLEETLRHDGPLVWIHCASLGEFEQGRPVIEGLRKGYPHVKILLTFFSPSGFEVRKTYRGADYIFYLPLDTPSNAVRFIGIIKPVLAIFVKYEFWYNYIRTLAAGTIPVISISSIFRSEQIFFRSSGELFRDMLRRFSHFFVQNRESVSLLASIGVTAVTLSGDTRFDRVYAVTEEKEEIPRIRTFKGNEKVFVVGSCWPEDLEVLAPFINENQFRLKFIIAPHEISDDFLSSIERAVHLKSVRFSDDGAPLEDVSVLLIDNVGMLSRLYRYGEFAYIGGGFGKGLHNILEAACYGIPILFGNRNFRKFKEANDLILRGGAFEIGNFEDLKKTYEMLLGRPENFLLACDVTRQYVVENLGATQKIIGYCSQFLRS